MSAKTWPEGVCLLVVAALSMTSACPYNLTECSCLKGTVECSGLSSFPEWREIDNDTPYYFYIFQKGNLSEIPERSFPVVLRTLFLKEIPVSRVSPQAFDLVIDSINILLIQSTRLTELPSGLLKVNKLTELTVRSSPISVWNETVLSHLGAILSSLTLINMTLTSWPQWLQYFTVLTRLDLSDNKLSQISGKHLPLSVNSLDLSDNDISFLDTSSFPDNSSLEQLWLDRNPLTSIGSESFRHLPQLYSLSMLSNKLAEIPLAFTDIQNLTYLYISPESGHLRCTCPRNSNLVRWYRSQNKLNIHGPCSLTEEVSTYLAASDDKMACCGCQLTLHTVYLAIISCLYWSLV